jgi:hypothetical protein
LDPGCHFTHYYFCNLHLRSVLGPVVMRLASFSPFQATYYLNGHSFIEQQLERAQIAFRNNDNAFLVVDDVAALQAPTGLAYRLFESRSSTATAAWGNNLSAWRAKHIDQVFSRVFHLPKKPPVRVNVFTRRWRGLCLR